MRAGLIFAGWAWVSNLLSPLVTHAHGRANGILFKNNMPDIVFCLLGCLILPSHALFRWSEQVNFTNGRLR